MLINVKYAAAAQNVSLCLFVDGIGNAQLMDTENKSVLSQFLTRIDFGGERLAIAPNGQACCTACYSRHGVTCYALPSGEPQWIRSDLKTVQVISFSPSGEVLAVCRERGACQMLDACNGDTIAEFRGVRRVTWNHDQGFCLLYRKTGIAVMELPAWAIRQTIAVDSFAVLSIASQAMTAFISEATGPLRAVNIESGVECWRFTHAEGSHYTKVFPTAQSKYIVGIRFRYASDGMMYCDRLNSKSGKLELSVEIPNAIADTAFSDNSNQLICSNYETINIESGYRGSLLEHV